MAFHFLSGRIHLAIVGHLWRWKMSSSVEWQLKYGVVILSLNSIERCLNWLYLRHTQARLRCVPWSPLGVVICLLLWISQSGNVRCQKSHLGLNTVRLPAVCSIAKWIISVRIYRVFFGVIWFSIGADATHLSGRDLTYSMKFEHVTLFSFWFILYQHSWMSSTCNYAKELLLL